MGTTYASLALTEQDHQLYEEALADFSLEQRVFCGSYDLSVQEAKNLFVLNPADTRETVAVFNQATPKDVDRAVVRGKKIWKEIEALGWGKRLEIMRRAAHLVEERKYRIAAILTYEAGKTRSEALAEVNEVLAMIYNYRNLLNDVNFFTTEFTNSDSPEESISLMRSLGGPVAVIVPFNFPFALAAGMSMAAFLAGNPVIIKPSNYCPLSTLQWRQILVEAGVPEEACGFLVGSGETVGEQLISHPDIAGVVFTGSLAVGQHIMDVHNKLWQKDIFRATPVLEMGGSNPVIVMPSADFKGAAEGILRSVLGYSGQKCSATRRIIAVGKKTTEELLLAIIEMVRGGFPNGQKLIVGDPRKRETYLGPLISSEAKYGGYGYANLLDSFEEKCKSPLELCDWDSLFWLLHGEADHGHFVAPLLTVGRLSHTMRGKEFFLPVAFLSKDDSLEQAVREANDTIYGLTAGIFSKEEKELDYFFKRIEAGSTYANRVAGATTGCWPGVQTFGGWKGSGSTGRNAFGKWYILNFLREQNQTRVKMQ